MACPRDDEVLFSTLLFSSDESSSSDEEALNLLELLGKARVDRESVPMYIDSVVSKYTDKQFRTFFRIGESLLLDLAARFERSDFYVGTPQQGGGRNPLSAKTHFLVFMWYVGHRAPTMSDVSDRFDITTDSVRTIIVRVNKFLDSISRTVITWPRNLNEVKHGFSKKGLQDVLGCADGTHIAINAPKDDPGAYMNRKKYFSIQLQVICNHERKFTDVFTGFPGSVHDARVMKNSFIYQDLPRLCSGGYIIADSAYELTTFCLTPYRDNGNLTATQKKFNKALSSTRVAIEHSIGILKQRFPILRFVPLRKIETICDIILSCCVIHNIASEEDLSDLQDEVAFDSAPSFPDVEEEHLYTAEESPEAVELRNQLAYSVLMMHK